MQYINRSEITEEDLYDDEGLVSEAYYIAAADCDRIADEMMTTIIGEAEENERHFTALLATAEEEWGHAFDEAGDSAGALEDALRDALTFVGNIKRDVTATIEDLRKQAHDYRQNADNGTIIGGYGREVVIIDDIGGESWPNPPVGSPLIDERRRAPTAHEK